MAWNAVAAKPHCFRSRRPSCKAELRTEIEGLPEGCYFFRRAGIRELPDFDLLTLADLDRAKSFIGVLERRGAWW